MAQERIKSDQELLASVARIMEMQSEEIDALRQGLTLMTNLAQDHAAQFKGLYAELDNLEGLLRQSDEGLSEALSFLEAMREGLSKISAATDSTIARFADIGYTPTLMQDVVNLSDAVSDAQNEELLDAHEKYLRALKSKIKQTEQS